MVDELLAAGHSVVGLTRNAEAAAKLKAAGVDAHARNLTDLDIFAAAARVSAYIGDGINRWPAVHRLDAAILFRLVVETAASGSRFHGAAEESIAMRDIAAAIGEGLGVGVEGK